MDLRFNGEAVVNPDTAAVAKQLARAESRPLARKRLMAQTRASSKHRE